MIFTVTYREKNGQKVQETINAESRAELFAQLNARNITALKVDVGASKVTHSSDVNITPKVFKLFAAILIVAICGIAVYIFLPAKERKIPSKDVGTKEKSAPVKVEAPKVIVTNTVKNVVRSKGGPGYYDGRKIVSVTTNATGYATIITVGEAGRRKRHIVAPPPIFKHATDEVIMVALMTPEGQEIPPLPDLGGTRADDEFREALKTPIEILPEDSSKVRAYKEAVKSARKEILQRLKEGEHFVDIIQDHCKLKNENGAIRIEAIAELKRIEKEDGIDLALKFKDQMNEVFRKMGITEIDLSQPKSIKNKKE